MQILMNRQTKTLTRTTH